MTVKPNRFLCAKISVIRAKTVMGDKNDQQMSSTQLDSHANMVVVVKKACIIQHSGKTADVWTFSNEFSNMENYPLLILHWCMNANSQ